MSTGDAELGRLKTFHRPGRAPMIPLDHALRLKWLTGSTRHEGRGPGDYYEQGEFSRTRHQPPYSFQVLVSSHPPCFA
jgi:hypothetical protein